jgi:hypothetical protein
VLPPERSATVMTRDEKTITTSTGMRRKGITDSQPPWNRRPSANPTAVIRMLAPTRVRAASASRRPVRGWRGARGTSRTG